MKGNIFVLLFINNFDEKTNEKAKSQWKTGHVVSIFDVASKKNITIIHKYKSIKEKYTKKETDTHNNNDDDNTKV